MIWLGWVLCHINNFRIFNAKSPLYTHTRYIGIGFVCFLRHINHCGLFIARSSLYIYIKCIGFCLVRFYGISTIVGYLMLNPLYTYILNTYDMVWLGFMTYQPLWVI